MPYSTGRIIKKTIGISLIVAALLYKIYLFTQTFAGFMFIPSNMNHPDRPAKTSASDH